MKLCHLLLICTLLFVAEDGLSQSTMVPWLTRSGDNSRSGWNQHETVLTQDSVTSKGIIRATIIPVIGDARGMEAQPLILPNVKTARGTRDVMVLPSMADVVRGVDAHDGSAIWQITLVHCVISECVWVLYTPLRSLDYALGYYFPHRTGIAGPSKPAAGFFNPIPRILQSRCEHLNKLRIEGNLRLNEF